MIPVPSGVRIWLAGGVTDMRCGMNCKRVAIAPDQVLTAGVQFHGRSSPRRLAGWPFTMRSRMSRR
jgi:hypothetical protein